MQKTRVAEAIKKTTVTEHGHEEIADEARVVVITGNRCGHDPAHPRFFKPDLKHKLRPDVIQFAIASLKNFYIHPLYWLRSLRSSRISARQERSEARERDADVLGVLLHYLELASLRVGFYHDDGAFQSIDMKFIAKKLGWRTESDDEVDRQLVAQGKKAKHRGVKRVHRALTAFKKAGYIDIYPRYEKRSEPDEDYYSGLPAVKKIHTKLLYELGISPQKLSAKRDEASRRLKRKHKIEQKLQLKLQHQAQQIASNRATKTTRPNAQHLEQEKRRQLKCLELIMRSENKQLSSDQFYAKYPQLKPQQRE